ncbi:MAG: hypothetical protein ABSF97_15070 [Candidatus Sulfotelmatobacter sp.]|jgi:hypothetical protein
MSYKSKLNPLSRTDVAAAIKELSILRSPSHNCWGVPLSNQNAKFLRSRLVYSSTAVPVGEPEVGVVDVGEESRKFRDIFLGLALTVTISASFWTGVGVLVSKLLR